MTIIDGKKTAADLRSNLKNIYLHHDPFKKGERFENWIKKFNHKIKFLNDS